MLFHLATVAPIDDKRMALPDGLRSAMGWPPSIRTMFDYRNRIPGVYNRLYQLCIISLCADIEFSSKESRCVVSFGARPNAHDMLDDEREGT